MPEPETATGDFKAKCLRLIDEVAPERTEAIVTKRGKRRGKLVPANRVARVWIGVMLGWILAACPHAAWAATGAAVQERMDGDARHGRALVAHVVVSLADNTYQGIVPVPEALGNGQDPAGNLYWGALYGVRTFFTRSAGWRVAAHTGDLPQGVLERIVLTASVEQKGMGQVSVYVVADAWDGKEIRGAIGHFLEMAHGRRAETVAVSADGRSIALAAGGGAHLVAYVGHNGLMEFAPAEAAAAVAGNPPKSAVVLACSSRTYFERRLGLPGVHALLMTKGLMAPEAYTLDAVLRAWFSGEDAEAAHEAAAVAYCRYQKCRRTWAKRRLFFHQP